MQRDVFIKSAAMLGMVLALPKVAHSVPPLNILIPANPGGGWDATGRALGRALVEAKMTEAVTFDNKGGSAGVVGLKEFLATRTGDPHALLVTGAVMLGGIVGSKSTARLDSATPIARLTNEYNVFVVPADSRFTSIKEVVAQYKKDPSSITWGGGSKGSSEHIAICMLSREVKVDPKKVTYVAFGGGGDASAALLGNKVTLAGSSYSEFAEHIQAGRMRALGITSPKRLPNVDIPTFKEQGFSVSLDNWRGVYAAPGITEEQRNELTRKVIAATKTKSWTDTLEKKIWTPSLLTGKEFGAFVNYELSAFNAMMYLSGML